MASNRLTALASALVILAFVSPPPTAVAAPIKRPIEVRVVIVTTWEVATKGQDRFGELQAWETRWPLTVRLPFAVGVHPLLYDPHRHVLAIVTGEATAHAAVSITALGLDPRFDLSHAYWIVAGTAGVDPKIASAGSVAWARWVVDGDLAQELDPRDAPPEWPTGIVPSGRTAPYQSPAPPARGGDDPNVAYALNGDLVHWAFRRSEGVQLPDDAKLAAMRAPYAGAGLRPPFVLEAEGLISARDWYGARLNDWAERWVDYWTGGKGVFAMSDEEDTGVMQALTQLAQAGRVRLDRVLILRGASDYTIGPPGLSAAAFLEKETKQGFPATPEALDNLYLVAAPIARTLADDWALTRSSVPGEPAKGAR